MNNYWTPEDEVKLKAMMQRKEDADKEQKAAVVSALSYWQPPEIFPGAPKAPAPMPGGPDMGARAALTLNKEQAAAIILNNGAALHRVLHQIYGARQEPKIEEKTVTATGRQKVECTVSNEGTLHGGATGGASGVTGFGSAHPAPFPSPASPKWFIGDPVWVKHGDTERAAVIAGFLPMGGCDVAFIDTDKPEGRPYLGTATVYTSNLRKRDV